MAQEGRQLPDRQGASAEASGPEPQEAQAPGRRGPLTEAEAEAEPGGAQGTEGTPISPESYAHLVNATPAERLNWVLRWVAEHPEGRLDLSARGDGASAGINLDGIDLAKARRESRPGLDLRGADLRGVRLRGANLARLDLSGADLRGASLGRAILRGTKLDEADLRDADFAGADLRAASLAQADLRGAMLEDADFRRAGLRFAKLEAASLEAANLRGADLWGVSAPEADFNHADLRGATLREADLNRADFSGADLRGAAMSQAALAGANLRGADLRRATIQGATLDDADLADAKLQGLDLTICSIARVKLCDAWLEKARLGRESLGVAVGEEVSGEYDRARKAYLGLERMFETQGDPDAASWAYRRRRRMQKLDALRRGQAARQAGDWPGALAGYATYASDLVVEWVCDYGESPARIFRTMLLVLVFFTLLYAVTGTVVRVGSGSGTPVTTRNLGNLAIFSLLAMTTPGNPPVGLAPRDVWVHLLTGLQAMLGIGLTGLLGFVAGNLVRR